MKLKDILFENSEILKDISPAQAAAIHRFLTKRLRQPAMEAKLRMSIFEQEFPLPSSLYDELQKTSAPIHEEVKKSFKLSELTFDILIDLFGKPGVALPLPSDSSMIIHTQDQLDQYKDLITKKFGDVTITLYPEEKAYVKQSEIEDEKFQAARNARVQAIGAWIDQERKAGRSID